eukprot:CAMPEP_0117698998 /NCGR_PEP_ID=MMETSP0804-20121206/30045_1 /TAXON_ID=1074897 /ORGANISM="Tetraselmis astigmatica, Strain CCMP880" /LENGTH=81 /DNA_ID=CAMNT_0005513321 /DNA_START=232 /DNA_END=478 /DNA_ORIENTATION=-
MSLSAARPHHRDELVAQGLVPGCQGRAPLRKPWDLLASSDLLRGDAADGETAKIQAGNARGPGRLWRRQVAVLVSTTKVCV